MNTDLVDRLRAFAADCRGSKWQSRDKTILLCDSAADEIAALQARVAELEKELAKAHLALNYFLLRDPDKPSSWEYTRDRAEQLARTTLAELTGGKDE